MQTVKIEAFKILGLAIKTTNEQGRASQEIAELWNRFLSERTIEKIPHKVGNTIYSLYTDYEGDHTKPYTCILGCQVEHLKDIPEGMMGKSIAGGKYVKTTAKGDLMKNLVLDNWSDIFKLPLDRNYSADFEVFGEKAQDPSNAEVDFYVGISH